MTTLPKMKCGLTIVFFAFFCAHAGAYLTDSNIYQVPAIPRPAIRSPITDQVFGSTITRYTDPSMLTFDPAASSGGTPQGLRHEYDRITALNSDKTMAVLTAIGGKERGGWFVYNLATGEKVLAIPGSAPNGPSITWSRTDPYKAIYYNGNGIDTINVLSKTSGSIVKFPQYQYTITQEEGTFSDSWQYAAFFGYKPGANWSKADLVCADLNSKTILGLIPDVTALPNWVGISPSGNYVVAMFDDYTKLYDRSMTFLRNLFPNQSHSDFAFDENGDECLVYISWSSAQAAEVGGKSAVIKVRLNDGKKTVIKDTQWKWGSHLSGMGTRAKPGWLLVSDYRTFHPPAAPSFTNNSPFQQEVFWLKMDGSGAVKRIAHHHSLQADSIDQYGSKDYWAEPHTVSSWDASTVAFCSIWGTPATHYDFYTVTGDWWNDASIRLHSSMKSDTKAGLAGNYSLLNGVDLLFNLANAGKCFINIYDLSGKRIWKGTYVGKAGLNNIILNRQSPQITDGVLFVKISQDNLSFSGKLIVTR